MLFTHAQNIHNQARAIIALKARADKRQKRNAIEEQDIKVQQNPASADFVCQTCVRRVQIKNWPLQPLQDPSTATLTSSKSMSPPPSHNHNINHTSGHVESATQQELIMYKI